VENKNLLILNVGNISLALDTNSKVAILHQILWGILEKLKEVLENVVKNRGDSNCPPLRVSIPDAGEFFNDPTPLQRFNKIFTDLKQNFAQTGWDNMQVVLLIDEFQYIYELIVEGRLEKAFMQHWKALLQENHFSAVLFGQDVMPKFKIEFANEFGTTEDRRVTYLNPNDAEELIRKPILFTNGTSRYREQAIERILDLTAGSPYYIQIICDRLVDHMNEKHVSLVTEADVEQVKNELINGVTALSEDKFHSFTQSGDKSDDAISVADARAVLKAIADNSDGQEGCPRHLIDCTTSLPVDTILEDLVRREAVNAVNQNQTYYRIQVGLFKEWLIAHG
jgi:hypothetical protein